MKPKLHVLHIEDSAEDSELVKQLLRSNGIDCQVTRVQTRDQVFDSLQNESFDLILSDCKLPSFSGLLALEISHALKPEIPFVFVSGTIGEETAIESLRNGATDYVLKDHLSRLAPAVRRAVTEAEERILCRRLQHRLHEVARLEAISTLSSGIAHDFNNILTIIVGHASLLSRECRRPERVSEIAETITQAAQRATEVVQQLMAFARKSSGTAVNIDLNRWIRDNLGLLKEKLPPHLRLTFEPDNALPPIPADASQLEQMLVNLFENAIDSMPDGGSITLSTRLVPASALPNRLPGLIHENYVCLKVVDTGSGMDLITRDHVFEPFYTTKERGRGTGLGLPVVYGLMQAHNGYIDVESEPGAGTMISLFFPIAQTQPIKTSPVSTGANPSLCGSETILVVEDEMDIGLFLEAILESHGYRVYYVHNHDQAMSLFKTRADEIDMVFSDIGMPKVDGITLCSKLKALKPGLPIILASGYSPKEFKARMEDLGNEAFLAKPFQPHEVLQSARKILDASKVTRGVEKK